MTNDRTTAEIDPPAVHLAERLATTVEMLSEDLLCPIEVRYRYHPGTTEVAEVIVGSLCADARFPPRGTANGTAQAIAEQLDNWSIKLGTVAEVIRKRFAG